jgi:hypothetical protein
MLGGLIGVVLLVEDEGVGLVVLCVDEVYIGGLLGWHKHVRKLVRRDAVLT